MLSKQDQAGVRTPEDVLRRINLSELKEALDVIERVRKELIIDSSLSTTSTLPVENRVITRALNNKVNVVAGKDLSANDFTDDYKKKLDTEIVNLDDYIVDGLSSSVISCINKNKRICIDFEGIMDFATSTETILLTLPETIVPKTTKNFLAIADTIVGYGTITTTGNLIIKYPVEVKGKITRFSVVYDLEEV